MLSDLCWTKDRLIFPFNNWCQYCQLEVLTPCLLVSVLFSLSLKTAKFQISTLLTLCLTWMDIVIPGKEWTWSRLLMKLDWEQQWLKKRPFYLKMRKNGISLDSNVCTSILYFSKNNPICSIRASSDICSNRSYSVRDKSSALNSSILNIVNTSLVCYRAPVDLTDQWCLTTI